MPADLRKLGGVEMLLATLASLTRALDRCS